MSILIYIQCTGICQYRLIYDEYKLCKKTHSLCTNCLEWFDQDQEETEDKNGNCG
jgi:hypothetical protein